jgi:hypothetical protein
MMILGYFLKEDYIYESIQIHPRIREPGRLTNPKISARERSHGCQKQERAARTF